MENTLNTSSTASAVEVLARGLVSAAKSGNAVQTVSQDGTKSFDLTNVDDAGKGGSYRIVITSGLNKSGKKYSHHALFRVNPDGSLKNVNLGKFKKKLFYTLSYNLEAGKVFSKIKQDPSAIKDIAKSMKSSPSDWKQEGDTICGKMGAASICITRTAQLMSNGKTMYRVSATKDGMPFLKGSQLMPLYK